MRVSLKELPTHQELAKQLKTAPVAYIRVRVLRALHAWERAAQHLTDAQRWEKIYAARHKR